MTACQIVERLLGGVIRAKVVSADEDMPEFVGHKNDMKCADAAVMRVVQGLV
jgi:hypothetical protein